MKNEMKLTSSYIQLNDVRFHAFHGVLPQEKSVGSDFVVNLRLGYDISSAMESDNVMETLNYSQVYEAVKEEITIPSNLLEHVAGRIAKSLHTLFPDITSIDLELTKLNPPMGADGCSASVEIHLINDKTQ